MGHLEKTGFDVNVCAVVYQPCNVTRATVHCSAQIQGTWVTGHQCSLKPAEPNKVYVFKVGRYAKFSAVSHLGWE